MPLSATIANVYMPASTCPPLDKLPTNRDRRSLTTLATSTGLAVGFGPRVTLSGKPLFTPVADGSPVPSVSQDSTVGFAATNIDYARF